MDVLGRLCGVLCESFRRALLNAYGCHMGGATELFGSCMGDPWVFQGFPISASRGPYRKVIGATRPYGHYEAKQGFDACGMEVMCKLDGTHLEALWQPHRSCREDQL